MGRMGNKYENPEFWQETLTGQPISEIPPNPL
jgi:hypothetical protein